MATIRPSLSGWFVFLGCIVTLLISVNGQCASSPCLNGGTCLQTGGLYLCNCTTGYQGFQCQTFNTLDNYCPTYALSTIDTSSVAVGVSTTTTGGGIIEVVGIQNLTMSVWVVVRSVPT